MVADSGRALNLIPADVLIGNQFVDTIAQTLALPRKDWGGRGSARNMKTPTTRTEPDERALDAMPAAEMSPDDFARHTLVIPVRPTGNPAARIRLEVAPGAEARIDDLRAEVERVMVRPGMSQADGASLVSRAVTECLSIDLRDQIWTSRLPNGKNIVLVRSDLLGRVSERDVVEFVHRSEVEVAMTQGRDVPAEVVLYYQSKQQPRLAVGGSNPF